MTSEKKARVQNFEAVHFSGIALDPIHVGTGGSLLGRVDNTIVRDPVTRIPKIPGSSLAGVTRAYAAMHFENKRKQESHPEKTRNKPYYPDCAGQGQAGPDGKAGHCGKTDCKICTVFGFAKNGGGGFAGLAGFSDMQVLLFPVATLAGPIWLTCPEALRLAGIADGSDMGGSVKEDAVYLMDAPKDTPHLNLGWLYLPVKERGKLLEKEFQILENSRVPYHIRKRAAVVSDRLFGHIVNSALEVRTSVSIDPATGAAQPGALFSYEALPRGTVLAWEVICRNPDHFRISGDKIAAVPDIGAIQEVVQSASDYLAHLGIGGMGSRGMGRLRVLSPFEEKRAGKETLQ